MEVKYIIATIALLLFAAPIVSASHEVSDRPHWAQGEYTTPQSQYWYDGNQQSARTSQYWYGDRQQYVIQDVYHPPKHYYVHYNQNYRDHARGHTQRYSGYRNYGVPTNRYEVRAYQNRNIGNSQSYYRPGQRVLVGDGWERHY